MYALHQTALHNPLDCKWSSITHFLTLTQSLHQTTAQGQFKCTMHNKGLHTYKWTNNCAPHFLLKTKGRVQKGGRRCILLPTSPDHYQKNRSSKSLAMLHLQKKSKMYCNLWYILWVNWDEPVQFISSPKNRRILSAPNRSHWFQS